MIQRVLNIIIRYSGWLLLVWAVLLSVLAVIPSAGGFERVTLAEIELRTDYLYHAVAFIAGTIPAILRFSLKHSGDGKVAGVDIRRYLGVVITMLLFGIAHEYLQKLITYRTFNVNDIISNAIGVIIGALIALLLTIRATDKKKIG